MIGLTSLLGYLNAVIQSHPTCQRIDSVETREFAQDQFIFKIRAAFHGKVSFQVRIYYNRGHIDYAYQLFSDAPLVRWDNKEEFRSISTYPHHHHDEFGNIHPSPLSGDPVADIHVVVDEIARFLA